MELSVVVPVFNEEQIIEVFYKRISKLLSEMKKEEPNFEWEVIWVNDRSTDSSLDIMLRLHKKNSCFKILNLSRNHGHQLAITAGMEYAKGDAVVIMDADLQDPPEFIANLYAKYMEGYDVVYAVRKNREAESFFKLITAKVYYRILKRLMNVEFPVDAGDFRLMSRRVVDTLVSMHESHRFIRGMVSWIGYKQCGIHYDREKRYAGTTKYPLRKMVKFALDGLTSFSTAPLRLASLVGFITALAGFLYAFYIIAIALLTSKFILGWATIVVLMLILGGIQLLTLGIIGEYIGRISNEVKRRPLYLVDKYYE